MCCKRIIFLLFLVFVFELGLFVGMLIGVNHASLTPAIVLPPIQQRPDPNVIFIPYIRIPDNPKPVLV